MPLWVYYIASSYAFFAESKSFCQFFKEWFMIEHLNGIFIGIFNLL